MCGTSVLSELESSLLMKINTPIPSVIQQRYNSLLNKRDKNTLAEDEYNELIELTNYTEQHGVQRLEYLAELSKLRNVTIDKLIEKLELNPGTNVAG